MWPDGSLAKPAIASAPENSDVVLIDEAMSCIHRLRQQIQAR